MCMGCAFVCMYVCVTVFIETYGCQMNVSDTEIAWSILLSHGFTRASNIRDVSNLHIYCLTQQFFFDLHIIVKCFSAM